MVAVAGPRLWETGDRPMSKTSRPSISAVETSKGPAPVRVRLKRVNCNEAIPYPPDGQAREWWLRLKNAFGTASSAFVGASLQRLASLALLWQIYSRRCALQIHLRQCGQRCGGSRAMSSTMA